MLRPLFPAALGLLVTVPAAAQDEEQTAIDALTDVIVVTATKSANAENVQDVPVAMTAYGETTLDALHVRDLEDLSFTAPNVALDDIGTTRGTANFAIRGLGVNSSIPSIDPAVGVFVDGVYMGVNSGVVLDLFDLSSVEVLRGPQGLLFGRNTTGGAVLVNTGDPTAALRVKGRLATEAPIDSGRGTWNSYASGVVSGPIVPGVLHGKVGAYLNKDGGYFENGFNGQDFGKATTTVLRGALEFMPTERLTLLGKIERLDGDGQGPAFQNRGFHDRDGFSFRLDEEGDAKNEHWFGTLKADLEVDFGEGRITNIFGWRDAEETTRGDLDASERFLFHTATALDQRQISNELRYAGTFDRWDVTTGLYAFSQDVAYDEARFLVRDLPFNTIVPGAGRVDLPEAPNPNAPPPFFGGGQQDHTVYGLFGQADYALTERLTLTGGLRWSREEKDAAVTYVRPRPECSVVGGDCPTEGTNPYTGEPNGFRDEDDWSNLTPKLGLRYQATPEALLYATYTKSFRSGGYNFRITDVALFLDRIVAEGNGGDFATREETVDAYEAGAKFQTEDRRLTLNGAVFYTDVSDMQREVNVAAPGAAVVQNIANTADAGILGLEVDGQVVLTDSLLLNANLGLIDAEYDEVRYDLSGDGVVDGVDLGLDLPRVPAASWGLGVVHDLSLGDRGEVVTRISFAHRDRLAYTDSNLGWVQSAYRLDANIAWRTPYEGLTVSIYGKNLLDEVQVGNDTQLPADFGLGPYSTGVPVPFGSPAAGTSSPLKKGRLVGIELTLDR
ncbi:TonB-dependent receptor [Parvularcula dongshanensis]|uniref:Iron complex outermembrane receptor protein n=1 Tax=Parvularcula dongshanensis TaxID=1173995 RepID=A0A840I172_9PROT|nr:TonB-dependent receptor [Parvularcula dongshanensis]MBB4657984.1 iron complex outermembrane receptor protein [Parvularcula dongshanensis]